MSLIWGINIWIDIQIFLLVFILSIIDEHSRVLIKEIPNYYINANEIKSLVDGQVFGIFSQAPVQSYDNFWEAVYYKNVTIVIMLCSFYDPKRGHQSEQYWPN